MPKAITDEKITQVIGLWLDGKSYEKIASETHVSTQKIFEIINHAKTNIPDLEELKNLKKSLKTWHMTIEDSKTGIDTKCEMDGLGITTDDIAFVKRNLNVYGDSPPTILETAHELVELESTTKISYRQLVKSYSATKSELDAKELQLKQLKVKMDEYKQLIPEYDRLKPLQTKLNTLNIKIDDLERFTNNQEELERWHFTQKSAEILYKALDAEHSSPENAAKAVSSLIIEGKSLRDSIKDLQTQKESLDIQIKEAQKKLDEKIDEQTRLTREISNLKIQMADEKSKVKREIQTLETKKKGLADDIHHKEIELSKINGKKSEAQRQLKRWKPP